MPLFGTDSSPQSASSFMCRIPRPLRVAGGTALLLFAGFSMGRTIAQTVHAAAANDAPAATPADDRIPVRTADDLPRFTYPLSGTAAEILADEARMKELIRRVIADVEGMLDTHRIEDPTALRDVYDLLSSAYSARGDLASAIEWSDRARELETKELEKAMRGVALKARAAALAEVGDDRARFPEVFRRKLAAAMDPIPYEVVKERLVGVRSQAKMVTRDLVERSLAVQLDPIIAAGNGTVPLAVVASLISTKFTLDTGLELLPIMADVYGEIIDRNAAAATVDLWTPRLRALDVASLPAGVRPTPVVVGIWDSGVDVSLFPGRLWTNSGETANGRDDDGNGFVDDIHGVAFDLDRRPTTGSLVPLDDLYTEEGLDLATYVRHVAASQDMQAGVENEGVVAFRTFYQGLEGERLRRYGDSLGLIGNYMHGTHVAGVAVEGNPYARIFHVTEAWPYKSIPDEAPTVEFGRRWGDTNRQAVEALKASGARVVNMSWRVGKAAFEGMLAAKGVGADAAERAELARAIFAELRSGLEEAIRSAPDILFIAGSGNEDNDVDFAEYVPAGLRLPNLITVGAIDERDTFTGFTSTGANVELYANGFRIDSVVPGGTRIRFSGTSMAAPQVSNLAAKLFAIDPSLTPAQVVALIREHAEPIPGREGRFVIHPARTIDALLARRGS